MIVVRFRSKEEHKDLLKKVKKMKEFTEELEDCLEEVMEDDDYNFRNMSGGSYRRDYDEDDMRMEEHHGGRYSYRKGSRM